MKKSKQKKLRLGVIFGGKSSEHEVSIHTAEQILAYLDRNKYEVTPIKISKTGTWPASIALDRLSEQIDLAFIAMHGAFGEDGTIQGMLEMLGIPYTFSGVLASSVAMDKQMSQDVAAFHGLLIPPTILIKSANYEIHQWWTKVKKLGKTVVVKPNGQGSSVGVTICSNTESAVSRALQKIFKYDSSALVQSLIKGREITAPILGNNTPQALPLIEIVPKAKGSTFYDYRAKYAAGGSEHIIPAPLKANISKQIQSAAVCMHDALRCRGVSRSDFIVTSDNKIYYLETNTIPGMTATSLLPQAASAVGISFSTLLDRIILLALTPDHVF